MRPVVRLAFVGCLSVIVSAWAGADPVFTLADPQVFTKPSRPWVRFDHGAHQALEGVSCRSCHHEFIDLEKGTQSPRCAACHTSPAHLQNAFHELCITCHDTEKRKGHVTGPRTCGECHATADAGAR